MRPSLALKKIALTLSVSLDELVFDASERGPDEALFSYLPTKLDPTPITRWVGRPSASGGDEVDGRGIGMDQAATGGFKIQDLTPFPLPLPGTLRLMVCPLEIALRRGSGECRMVEMDSPELKTVGDAREVINIDRVYQWGDN